jgi:hypothetical protein
MDFFIAWIVVAIIVGVVANSRGRSGFGWFVLAVVISPVIAFLLVIVLPRLDTSGSVRSGAKVGESVPAQSFSFGRAVVIVLALIAALIVAGIAVAFGIIAPDWRGVDSDPIERATFFIVAFFATSFVGMAVILPAFAVIAVAEVMRLRSFLYYGIAGGLLGLASYFTSDISARLENTTDVIPVGHLLQLAAAAGILAGLTYWLLAGRNAGGPRAPA